MHVVFIANCERSALARTRTLLDRYAPRIGDRAWATLITRDALEEAYKALRRQASRHTSVACYRSDAVFGLRLVWIVGNREHYDTHERFAVATQAHPKEFPMPFRHAALIARLAGYVHDLGKASQRFQDKLNESCGAHDPASRGDAIRHEWLSAWLMQHLLSTGPPLNLNDDTLARAWEAMKLAHEMGDGCQGRPMNIEYLPMGRTMNTACDALLWAVGTHHGAMGGPLDRPLLDGAAHIRKDRPYARENVTLNLGRIADPTSAPQDADRWIALYGAINRTVTRIRDIDRPAPYWEGVMLLSRAALILADQKVSSETFDKKTEERESGILFANTKPRKEPAARSFNQRKKPKTPTRYCDQPLSWHLWEVGNRAADNIRMFAGDDLPVVDAGLVRATLDRRANPGTRYYWQDQAVDQVRAVSGGQLIFNVAATGAGKTLANLKMAFALRPNAVRLAVAFNLRSLTQQTFAAFRKDLSREDSGAFDRDFACLLGDQGLPGTTEKDSRYDESRAKEDEDDIAGDDPVDLEGAAELQAPEWLKTIAKGRSDNKEAATQVTKLIASPVLISTMDWIVAAGEPGQQQRHAKALIRIANSDLILDEVDSYDVRATVAVMRVVKIAASFGRNVIVSSATLNPELAKGLCLAYARGRQVCDALFGAQPWRLLLISDKFDPVWRLSPSPEDADAFYRHTMQEMADGLTAEPVTKRYAIAPVVDRSGFFTAIADAAASLHEWNAATPPGLSCRLSIGLVRVAQVRTCMDLAEHLRADGRFIVTAYHAQDVRQRRAWKERHLDKILSRADGQPWVDALGEAYPAIREATGDVRLIVVATPVEEVGRDHDFDWAVIEPSSIHSIIQTAGRVNRHRRRALGHDRINVVLLSRNLRDLDGEPCAFTQPGLETFKREGGTTHPSHDLNELMRATEDASTPGGTLDAGLIFAKSRKAWFAQYDEAAIVEQMHIATPIIGRELNYEMHFMAKELPRTYPLRDDSPSMDLRTDPDRRKFFLKMAGKQSDINNGDVCMDAIPDRGVWLTPSWDDEDMEKPDKELFLSIRLKRLPNKIRLKWHGVLLDPDSTRP